MTRATSSTRPEAPAGDAPSDDRQWFVTADFQSMPVFELLPLHESTGQWISAAIRHKILRAKVQPLYVLECRRLVKAKHVPKRMQKYFDELASKLKMSGFKEAFHTTVGAIGPYSSTTLVMSHEDGDVHFFASQTVTQVDGQIQDETHFGFVSWLKDGTIVLTTSPLRMARPRKGVERLITASDDPNAVRKKHRERILRKSVERVPAEELFDRFEAENEKQTDDWLRRRVIRPANPAELTRIRNATRV